MPLFNYSIQHLIVVVKSKSGVSGVLGKKIPLKPYRVASKDNARTRKKKATCEYRPDYIKA